MTLREKYEEIMEKVVVTDDMRRRILYNVRCADIAPKPKVIRFPHWQRYAAAAACIAVLLIGALTMTNLLHSRNHPAVSVSDGSAPIVGVQNSVECKSAVELSKTIGFPISDLSALPFKPASTAYLSSFGEIAEIDYTGADGETAVYRKSVGTEDNSGIYDTFPDTKQISVGGVSAALKGDGGKYTLAVWTDGTYSYSVVLSSGAGTDEWSAIIKSVS
jgi:hypothetical protein